MSGLLIAIFALSPLMQTMSAPGTAHAQTVQPVTLSFYQTNPIPLAPGDTSTLVWTSANATNCVASDGWTGPRALSGTREFAPTLTTTYTLTCSNSISTVTRSVTMVVVPRINISVASSTVLSGTPTTITWTTANATACYASDGWTGARALSGSETVTPMITTTYTLTCSGAGGTVLKKVTVFVAPLITLTVDPTAIGIDEFATLSWSVLYADSCTASGGWSGPTSLSGSMIVAPTETTEYSLTCTGPGGTRVKTVTLRQQFTCPIISLLPADALYTMLMAYPADTRSDAVLCVNGVQMQLLFEAVTVEQMVALLMSLSPDAQTHVLSKLTTEQTQAMLDVMTCNQIYTLITASAATATYVLNRISTTQLTELISCLTNDQIRSMLTNNVLSCNLQTKILRAMPQDRLDSFLEAMSSNPTALNTFFTSVCGEAALLALEKTSEETRSLIVPLLTIATIGIILFALSAAGQAALTNVLGASLVAAARAGGGFISYGGRALTELVPCTCMPGWFMLSIGPPKPPVPAGELMLNFNGFTRLLPLRVYRPPAWQIGLGAGNIGCYQYAGGACATVGTGPAAWIHGTSAQ